MPGDQVVPWLPKLGLFSASVLEAEQPKPGRELAHRQNEGWFVVQLIDRFQPGEW